VGVEKRLLEDAESFKKRTARLDEEGFIQETLAALGVPPEQDTTVSDAALVAGRIQRPATAGDTGTDLSGKTTE
jgi:hypothetical protein